MFVLVGAIVVLLLAGGAALVVRNAKGYYVFAPGTAPVLTASARCAGPYELTLPNGSPCARVEVPARLAHALSGQLFMVDVDVGPATPVDYLLGKLHLLGTLRQGFQLIPAVDYTGGATPNQVRCADTAQMTSSQADAPVAALRRLGYPVQEVDRGASVIQVGPGTPASAAGIHCNDTITAINGKAVHTAPDLVNRIHSLAPGQTVTVTSEVITSGGKTTTKTIKAKLTTTPAADAKKSGDTTKTAFLGIATATDVTYHMPIDVTINAGDIGGPSAGLAFTLGIIDLLSNGHLTGGHRVAATGEIDPNGNVIDVGGVAQKTIAVERAGATAFIVPKSDYAAAESEAGGKLTVYPVTTLNQALADLAAMGGTIPPPPR